MNVQHCSALFCDCLCLGNYTLLLPLSRLPLQHFVCKHNDKQKVIRSSKLGCCHVSRLVVPMRRGNSTHALPSLLTAFAMSHSYVTSIISLAGHSVEVQVTATASGLHTGTVHVPEGCLISGPVQGPERPTAAAAESAAARKCLQQLHVQGGLAGYWSSAALLQQAGMEGGLAGGDPDSDAVLWRCGVCGVPATSARNLEVLSVLQQRTRLACVGSCLCRNVSITSCTLL